MNSKIILLPACLALLVLGCKKETKTETIIQEPNPAMEGNWDGFYGVRTINGTDTSFREPTAGYSMVLKSGGKATVYDGALKDTGFASRAEGTWIYSTDNSVVVDYRYASGGTRYIIKAKVDTKMKALNGKWIIGLDGTVGGLFYMVKK